MVDGQQICTNDSIFLQGAYQFSSGTYVDTLNSVACCDSIVTTYLVVDNTLYGNDTASICFGDSILVGWSYANNSRGLHGYHYLNKWV